MAEEQKLPAAVESLKARYLRLAQTERAPYLTRARENAKLTIPSLMPPEGYTPSTPLPQPYQGFAARGINSLSAKMVGSLLPPNQPFFRKVIKEYAKIDEKDRTKFDASLSRYETAVMKEIEASGDRPVIHESFKHLLNDGNALLYTTKENKSRLYKLDSYVVVRDAVGNVLEGITHERVARVMLNDEIANAVQADRAPAADLPSQQAQHCNPMLDVYTCFRRKDVDTFETWQEINEIEVPGSRGTFKADKSPYIAMRYARVDGESYSRSLIEEFYGDIASLEGLSQSLLEGAADAARVVNLVNPNGVTKKEDLENAANGDYIVGNADDVKKLQSEKFADFRFVSEQIASLKRELEPVFLMHASATRDAERVTAEEIRFMAAELDEARGGLYSILAAEFQLPYVQAKIHRAKGLPALPDDLVDTTIVTGVEALGRGQDLQRLDLFLRGLQEQVGPENVAKVLNLSEYITRRATALAIKTDNLIYSQEQVQQQDQLRMLQELTARFGPEVIKQIPAILEQQQKGIASAPQVPQGGIPGGEPPLPAAG